MSQFASKRRLGVTISELRRYGVAWDGAMPRYFFDVHDGFSARDDEGVELPNSDAARKQVWNTLPALAADREADGNMACQLRMDVRDESGKHVFHAVLALVIEPAT